MIRMKKLVSSGIQGANEGYVARGREFVAATEERAKEMEAAGLAYRLVETKAEQKPLNKMEPAPSNKASASGPLPSVGGKTGAESVPSLSDQDHLRRKPRSNRSRDGFDL